MDGADENEASSALPPHRGLGTSLAKYVEDSVVDPLTEGRHRLLRETARRLCISSSRLDPAREAQLDYSLKTLPQAARSLVELRKIATQQLDMGALIKCSDELFIADTVWAGKMYAEEQRRKHEEEQERALEESSDKNALQYLQFAIQSHEQAQAGAALPETQEMLEHAMEYSANLIVALAQRAASEIKLEEEEGEDPTVRDLRLNLLALSKRAPLDKIARLPPELVPESIRHIVPTIDSRTDSDSSSSSLSTSS